MNVKELLTRIELLEQANLDITDSVLQIQNLLKQLSNNMEIAIRKDLFVESVKLFQQNADLLIKLNRVVGEINQIITNYHNDNHSDTKH